MCIQHYEHFTVSIVMIRHFLLVSLLAIHPLLLPGQEVQESQAQVWQPLPLVTAAQRTAGVLPGGEGCQYPCALAVDPVGGQVLLYGTDVGGIFRSADGAGHWQPADLGWKAVGAINFAFDSRDPQRVLAVGSASGNQGVQSDGLYLSLDQGRSWSQVLAVPRIELSHDDRTMLAFDPSSSDAAHPLSRTVYFALQDCPNHQAGLYRSGDGGRTWIQAATGAAYGGAQGPVFVAVPGAADAPGALVIGSRGGLFRSTDHGATFTRIGEAGAIEGLATVDSAPGKVWASRGAGLLRSDDGGRTFAAIPQDGSVKRFARISVSPADPQRIATRDFDGNQRRISHDGGRTWKTATAIYNREEFIPADLRTDYRDRNIIVAWHPTDPNVAWATGPGDLLWRSDDGGVTFTWANNGINNVMIGGLFNFAVNDPQILYFGSQDYNGGLTRDGGTTWSFINLTISNTTQAVRQGGNDADSWGWVYGGYSPDGTVIYGGNNEYQGKHSDLWISFDGGRTSERKVEGLSGAQVSISDPRDPQVLFCWGWRSADRGRSWTKMTGCDGVFTVSAAADRTLYGRAGAAVVRSTDHGSTWQTLTTLKAELTDLAYDQRADRVWATADKVLYRCDGPTFAPVAVTDRLPKDHFGSTMLATTVAIDPVEPQVVYVGALGTGLWVQRDATVARSLDGGATWERLTCNPDYLAEGWVTGGQMTSALRVNPASRWLYAATCCYGWWRFPPPPAALVGKPVIDHGYQPPLKTALIAQVPDHSLAATGADGLAVKVLRDFGPTGFEYTYGESWKNGENVTAATIDGSGCVTIEATEHGGGGVVLGGIELAPQGQTHLLLTIRPLAGNSASALSCNISRAGAAAISVSVDLAKLPTDRFSNVLVPLPGVPGDYAKVEQIQIQGTNWSPGAGILHLAIDRLGTTTP